MRQAEILLVEDNQADVVLTKIGFEDARLKVNLNHVENGLECMKYLNKEAPYEQARTPDLILLDLNMPLMDGREVLSKITQNENLCHLPVVVLTTSESDLDLLEMYKLRCSSYIQKPVDFNQFKRVVREFSNYWFTLVVLPNKDQDFGVGGK